MQRVRGGDASPPPLCLEGRSRRPPVSEDAASEVGDELRRRGVEAHDVEHPRIGRVGKSKWLRPAGLEPAASAHRRTALYGREKSLRQELNPHLGRTKGACLPLTLRRQSGDGRSRTDIFLVASEALVQLSYIPVVRTGGVEPPQHEATGLQPVELAVAQRPHGARGGRPGSNRRQRSSQPRVLPSTPRPPRSS